VRNNCRLECINREKGRIMKANPNSGIVIRRSVHSVDETVRRLEEVLEIKGIRLFAAIDHSGEAEKVGMQMPNTKLLIFGNPKAGTPIMVASPSAALDLPLKILLSEDSAGDVWLSHNSTNYLQNRHGFSGELAQTIAVVEVLAKIAGE
jgi:uncharacterized protein (DUF302 family)